MTYRSYPVSENVSDLYARVSTSGRITTLDRRGLKTALLSEKIEEEDRLSVDRLLRGVRRGCIQIADEDN